MGVSSLNVGQAVRLQARSAWDNRVLPHAIGLVVGIFGPACYRLAPPIR